jgi:hypothetical protein
LIYLEPQYTSLTKWESIPTVDIGITCANIPGTNLKGLYPEDEEVVTSDNAFAEDFYRQGLHLGLSLALAMNFRLTPHWQLSPSTGCSCMSMMVDEEPDEEEERPQNDAAVKIFTTSSHTPKSSLTRYPHPNAKGS